MRLMSSRRKFAKKSAKFENCTAVGISPKSISICITHARLNISTAIHKDHGFNITPLNLTWNGCSLVDVDDIDSVEVSVWERLFVLPGQGQWFFRLGVAFFAPTPTGGELEVEGSSRVRELKRDKIVFIVEATVVENHASGHLGGKLQAHIELGSLMVWSLLNSIFCQLFTVQEQYFSIIHISKKYSFGVWTRTLFHRQQSYPWLCLGIKVSSWDQFQKEIFKTQAFF